MISPSIFVGILFLIWNKYIITMTNSYLIVFIYFLQSIISCPTGFDPTTYRLNL